MLLMFSFVCNLHFLDEINLNGAKTLCKMYCDVKLYNTMMGREVNFRRSDLSSAFNDWNPTRYLKRLFEEGNKAVLKKIEDEKPLMNFLVHNLLPYAQPVLEAFGNNAYFIDVVRHPLYMIIQQAINMDTLINTVRDVDVYISYKGKELPFLY